MSFYVSPSTARRGIVVTLLVLLSVLAINGTVQRSKLAPLLECEAMKGRIVKLEEAVAEMDERIAGLQADVDGVELLCE